MVESSSPEWALWLVIQYQVVCPKNMYIQATLNRYGRLHLYILYILYFIYIIYIIFIPIHVHACLTKTIKDNELMSLKGSKGQEMG